LKYLRSLSILAVIAVMLITVLVAGCTQTTPTVTATATPVTPATRTITDMMGNNVTIPANVTAVADSWPAHNEVMVMLGAADKLVATTPTVQTMPWFIKIYPRIATMPGPMGSDVNMEDLLKANPDLVILTTGNNATGAEITERGIPVVYLYFTNFDQLKQSFLLTGSIMGAPELQKAKDYNAYLDSKIASVNATASTIPQNQKLKVLHIASLSPLKVDGNNTLIDTWITTSGGINAAGQDVSGNMQAVSIEQVLKWNPDVIIVGGTVKDRATIMNDTQWKQVKAVQDGRVYVNPKGVFPWDRYGAEEALQIQWASKTLYPEKFQSVNISDETKYFYKTYFSYNLSDSDVDSILNPTS
jgi:iron complex transport system substrate-binding protein